MELSVAIDFSTAEAAIAISEKGNDQIIYSSSKPMTGREASFMMPWIITELKKQDLSLKDICQWTCGTGPGSFTGLRIIASLIAGLSFSKDDIQLRGVPSGSAIIKEMAGPEDKTAVLYDGRRNELICFTSENLPLITISSENVKELNEFSCICAMHSEKCAAAKILPGELLKKIKFIDHFPIEKLLQTKSVNWHRNINGRKFFEPKLIYIRPAV